MQLPNLCFKMEASWTSILADQCFQTKHLALISLNDEKRPSHTLHIISFPGPKPDSELAVALEQDVSILTSIFPMSFLSFLATFLTLCNNISRSSWSPIVIISPSSC